MAAILEVTRLTKNFGGLAALNHIDLEVHVGQILGLIGPNGSGKSTFFNVVSGIGAPSGGRIVFRGDDITNLSAHEITRRGLCRTFQKTRLYGSISVLKNVMIGAHCRTRAGVLAAIFRPPWVAEEEKRVKDKAVELLDLFGLAGKADALAGSLPLGQRKSVEIARALASQPTLLMVDEPAAGLTFAERQVLVQALCLLRDAGQTIVLVEHNMEIVMDICDRIAVLNYGSKIFDGVPEQAANDREVVRAYLGVGKDDAVA